MVRNLPSPRTGNAVANQFLIKTQKGTFFQSYQSIVAKVDNKGQVWLSVYWNYSRTTTKYLYQFLREFGWYDLNASEVCRLIKVGTFKYQTNLTM